jgi:outer membrane protein assembly factor BamA
MLTRYPILALMACLCACASGPRATVAERDAPFLGNKAISTSDLLAEMESCQESGGKADVCIIGAYYDRGYINVKIGAPDNESSTQKFTIDEGPRFRIGKTSFSDPGAAADADSVGDPAALRALMTFASGDWFNRSQVNAFVEELTRHYQKAGYASAKVTPLTKVDVDRHSVEIEFSIVRGDASPRL